eukprot:gene8062-10080_t
MASAVASIGGRKITRHAAEKAVLKETHEVNDNLTCLGISSSSGNVAVGCQRGVVKLWRVVGSSLKKANELVKHSDSVSSLSFSPGGQQLASGSKDTTICIWETSSGCLIQQLHKHTGSVSSVIFSLSGTYMISGGEEGCIVVWDPQKLTEIQEIQTKHVSPVTSLAVNPHETLIAQASADHSVYLWRLRHDEMASKRPQKDVSQEHAFTSSDGPAENEGLPSDGSIGLSSLSIEQETIEAPLHPIFLHLHLGRHKDMIAALEFTLDGKNLITVSQDKTAILWDSSTGAMIQQIRSTGKFSSCCISGKGNHAVFGTTRGIVEVWAIIANPAVLLASFQAHQHCVVASALSFDGRLFITGSQDRSLKVWILPERMSVENRCISIQDVLPRASIDGKNKDCEHTSKSFGVHYHSIRDSVKPRLNPKNTTSPTMPIDDEHLSYNVDQDHILLQARLSALHELLAKKRSEIQREKDSANAMQRALQKTEAECTRRARMETRLLALRKDIEASKRVGGPIGVQPSRQFEVRVNQDAFDVYIDAIHRRLDLLYKRVGRKPRGTT